MATGAITFEDAARRIRAMDAEFMANVEAKHAVRLVDAFYAEDARLLPPNDPAVHGKAAIRAFWEALLTSGVKALRLDTTHIEVSGDLAFAIGNYTMLMDGEKGAAPEHPGKYLVAYRRDAGGMWRAVADMFSPDS